MLVVNDTPGQIDIAGIGRKIGQGGHIVFELRITVELRFEHLICSSRIGLGRMRIVEVLVAIKLISGREGTLLHLVEYGLHVDEFAPGDVDGDSGSQQLFDQKGNVETIGIVPGQVAPFEVGGNGLGHLLEGGTVGYIGIGNLVHGGCLGRYGPARVDAHRLRLFASVGVDFQVTDFHDTVGRDVDAGCFEVEKDQRIFKIQLHGATA